APVAGAPMPAAPAGEEGQDAYGPVIYEPMNAIRRKTAEHLAHAWSSIPHVTHFDKADITELEEVRKRYAKKMEAAGGRLTLICFVLKVLVEAFRRFPKFNATVDLEHQRLVLKRYCHIGVAVDTPAGLVVPVLRDVDKKSILELAVALPALAEKARARKLALEDMQGGGFTVTNLGGLGGTGFTPIINAPEVAILGMSRSAMEPVYRDNAFLPRLMLPLSLSYDHRVIDGADAARFLRFVAEALENPWAMWMEKGNMP
ncbi:MAG TPA: branched-chain alpha-keto acid dehydrogenase subunit E2, partial [Candidatus Hydrogenedentes bacterium]|nr:branched-chain alpha-keto acid dehydrogenase subunit E2 [Candidatus Hydrogenedentota bacterium]